LVKAGAFDVPIELKAVDSLQGLKDVAVPQESLQPLQFIQDCFAKAGVVTAARAFSKLAHDRDAHRSVKPIEVVLRLRIQIQP
jgi:hypothetical protein